jgi:hypothetical protein
MRAVRVAGVAALTALLPLALLAEQRDTSKPAPAGSGEISGRVTTAEANPQPLRRAVVTLTGDVPNPRSVLTDDDGRFAFSRLPAGTFSVTAKKAAYLAAPYGARRPGRTGVPIALADGQRLSIAMAMFRGSAISGVLRDAAGAPVRGVNIRAIDARTLLTAPDASPAELASTDDRGAFRLYGLLPGEYFVAALPLLGGSGEIIAPSAASIDAALAMLGSRRPAVAGQPGAPAASSPAQPRAIGFGPVYYPGTPNHSEAVRVRVEPGDERASVDFELRPVQMAAIDGVVRDVASFSGVQVSIIPSGPRISTVMSSNSLSGRPIDAEGRFRYSNLPPGSYRIVARGRRGDVTPSSSMPTIVGGVRVVGGGGSGAGAPAGASSTGDYLYGVVDVELRGDDVADLSIHLQPGGTMSGRFAFAGSGSTPVPADLSKMRVSLSLEGATGGVSSGGLMMGTSLLTSPITTIKPDGTFEIRGIGPGRYTVNATFPSTAEAGAWKLRSVLASGRNVLDDVLDLGTGTSLSDVTIRFSDELTQLSGTLQGATGQLITEYYIVAIPADKSMWRPRGRRILSMRPATDGRFVFSNILAGEYVIAALTDLDPIDLWDPAFLTQIAAAGAPVTVADGEKKVHDLRIK